MIEYSVLNMPSCIPRWKIAENLVSKLGEPFCVKLSHLIQPTQSTYLRIYPRIRVIMWYVVVHFNETFDPFRSWANKTSWCIVSWSFRYALQLSRSLFHFPFHKSARTFLTTRKIDALKPISGKQSCLSGTFHEVDVVNVNFQAALIVMHW